MGAKATKSTLNPKTLKDLQDKVDFTPEEIESWHKEFKKSLSPGHKELTKAEFKTVYNSMFSGDGSDFAESVFRTFDRDRNGTVNFEEFLIGLCISGSTDFDVKLKWAFSVYDMNNDGYITWDEMKHIISAIYKMTEFKVDEEVNTPDKMTEKLFRECDIDQDGRISYTEFYELASKDPTILLLLQCNPEA